MTALDKAIPSAYLPELEELFASLADRDLRDQLRRLKAGEPTLDELYAMDVMAQPLRLRDGHVEDVHDGVSHCAECGQVSQTRNRDIDFYYHPTAAIWWGVGDDGDD